MILKLMREREKKHSFTASIGVKRKRQVNEIFIHSSKYSFPIDAELVDTEHTHTQEMHTRRECKYTMELIVGDPI